MTTLARTYEKMQDAQDRWLRLNRGVLADIARRVGVSHGKVRLTYMGAIRCADPAVVRELRNAGAPGFDIDENAAA